jgi:16S rRNA (cytidine1402-2'-O)-methyltransferase
MKPSHSQQRSKREAAPRPGAGAGALVLVATPIGNLGDITARALDGLRSADVIACEDSRVTAKLLAAAGIERPLLPYHDHNAEFMRPKLLARIAAGEQVALVSDAGTPLISDPGYKLVQAAVDAGLAVTMLPGPSAPVMALALSGLPSDRFLFGGFLPAKSKARRAAIAEAARAPVTLVFFETAPRLLESLKDLHAVLGERQAAVARELTKLFEETRRGTLASLAAHYAESGAPKGEIVVVIAPPAAEAAADSEAQLDDRLAQALESESVRDAAAAVAAATGLPRRRVYARALELARKAR